MGNKLRGWSKSAAESQLRKKASKEVSKLKPRIYSNPVIRSLDAITSNPETDFDPIFDCRNWVDEFESPHYYRVTAEAIREVYQEMLDNADLGKDKKSHIQWIKSLVDSSEH